MQLPSFEDFAADAQARGFTQTLVRDWAPGQLVPEHSHPFAASALIVAGEMWLTVGETTRHLRVGDRFELESEVAHAERYGPDGATYWVARASRGATPR
jgi:quercetin dioxygenase-like cupin family protein